LKHFTTKSFNNSVQGLSTRKKRNQLPSILVNVIDLQGFFCSSI